MGIHPEQLRELVIRPVLRHIDLWSEAAEVLLLGTAAIESEYGTFLAQHPSGPARSIYQIEPATMHDALVRAKKKALRYYIRAADYLSPDFKSEDQLVWNLGWATAVARLIYYLVPEPLPAADDWQGLSGYYKLHFNSLSGATSLEKAAKIFRQIVEKSAARATGKNS